MEENKNEQKLRATDFEWRSMYNNTLTGIRDLAYLKTVLKFQCRVIAHLENKPLEEVEKEMAQSYLDNLDVETRLQSHLFSDVKNVFDEETARIRDAVKKQYGL